MSLNSVKNIALAASLLAAVACGKNKNNLNIDGTYEVETISFTDSANKTYEEAEKPSAVEIKNNIMTMYSFSDDKKAVEITSVKLDVKGKRLSGTSMVGETICSDVRAASEKVSGSLEKTKDRLVIRTEQAEGRDLLVLKSISAEKFAEITKDLKTGKIEKACIVDGKVQKKLGKIQAEDQANTTEVISSADESSDKAISSEEENSMDEATLKRQSNGSGEKEQSDLVSEIK